MAERGTEGQRTHVEDTTVHTLIYSAICECCERDHVSSIFITDLPPPWPAGEEEMLSTGTNNTVDHWIELIRMQQQVNADPLCDPCSEVIKELIDGDD